MKRLDVSGCDYPKSDGRCSTFEAKNKSLAIVTIGKHIDGKDSNGIVGLLVHEAVHVWQLVRKEIGESDPSPEFEAYSIQAIAQELIDAYSESRGAK